MADYGFDPSIILGGMQKAPDANETFRTFADVAMRRAQMQMQQQQQAAALQEEAYKHQRALTLADIARKSAGSFEDPMARAYALGGFGDEAGARQRQRLQFQVDNDKFHQLHGDLLRSQASTIKTKEQGDKWLAQLSPETRATYGLPDEHDPKALQAFIASGLEPDKRGKFEDDERRRADLAAGTSTTSQIRGDLARQLGLKVQPGAPGNTIDDKELELGERAQAAKERAAMMRMLHGPTEAPPTNPASLEVEADHFNKTGTFLMPGRSKEGLAHNRQVLELANQRRTGVDPATAAATYKADSSSLHHAQTQRDTVMGFVRTFDKNINMLEDAAAKLKSSNSPFLNKGLRWYQENGEGDPNLTAFRQALSAVTSEAGKINSGSTGAGGVPISVLQEMEHNLPPNATPAQVVGALRVLRADSENRRAAMDENLGEIKGRISGKVTPLESLGGTGKPASVAPTHYLHSPDGKWRIPAGPDGKPLPGAKPEADPNPPAVASRG